jgi:hypothetical protein
MKYTSILALIVLAAVPALALNDSTWVSHSGADFPACGPIASPCATFQFAHNQTNSGGIVRALDAGEYGKVTISKPVTIDGNGVGASITTSGGSGIVGVNVQTPGIVTIRNLAIHIGSCASACYGIYSANSDVDIENVSITGTLSWGVDVNGGTASIHGLTVRFAFYGIYVSDAIANISDSIVVGSTFGIYARGASLVTQALIERSRMFNNGTGLAAENAGAASTARISDCVITGNTTGVSTVTGGQIISFRNNSWAGNGADGTTPFSVSLK